jgi:hypothetical protein
MVLDMSRLGFAPPPIERYTLGPLGITVSSIALQGIVTKELVTGYRNTVTRIEYKPVKRITRYSDQGVDHGDIFKVPPRVV